jgi:hypothetical protein
MVADVDISQRWQILESIVGKQIGRMPELDDHLLFIGIREAGLPPQPNYTEAEKAKFIQMAECTVLAPARYFELVWVEDSGWPHFNTLRPLPRMKPEEKVAFMQSHILQYAVKNKIVK